MRPKDLFDADESAILEWFQRDIAPNLVVSASLVQNELQRRATLRLHAATEELTEATSSLARSSDRLERYTKWLLALTFILLLAAAPPAIDAIIRWLR